MYKDIDPGEMYAYIISAMETLGMIDAKVMFKFMGGVLK